MFLFMGGITAFLQTNEYNVDMPVLLVISRTSLSDMSCRADAVDSRAILLGLLCTYPHSPDPFTGTLKT